MGGFEWRPGALEGGTHEMGFVDETLGDLSSSDESEAEEETKVKEAKGLSVEALKRNGYRAGPSVMLQESDQGKNDWTWGKGSDHAGAASRGVNKSERDSDHAKANEYTVVAAKRGLQRAAKLKKLRKKERVGEKNDQYGGSGPKKQ